MNINKEFFKTFIQLKPYTIIFFVVQCLDIITTYVGLSINCVEQNLVVYTAGWSNILTVKLLIAFIIPVIMQLHYTKPKLEKFAWFLTGLASLVPVWNIYIIARYA